MAMRYTRHLVQTRTAAGALSIFLVAMLTPFLAMHIDLSKPARAATLVALTLLPVLVAFRCLRFLSQQERQHTTPTPEMKFIFDLAVTMPLVFTAVVLILFSNYK